MSALTARLGALGKAGSVLELWWGQIVHCIVSKAPLHRIAA